jgi:hypothetical protein
MNESQLYNVYSASNSAFEHAAEAKQLIIKLNVLHLRLEHNMPLHEIAKRCNIKMKQVQSILFNHESQT